MTENLMPAATIPARTGGMPRLPMLDGWRGISIVLVLMTHMLPLGPARFRLNETCGMIGMAIFFSLSGFLITSTLFFHPSVKSFLIRRLFRIVPVAWLFMLVVLPFVHADKAMWRADLLFFANLPPFFLVPVTGHLWSLCVEVQFYLAIATTFLFLRERGLSLLPLACLAVTALRIWYSIPGSIVTIYRVDEILSGAALAWLFHGQHAGSLQRLLKGINPFIPLALLCLSGHPALPWLNYGRPYFAAILVGTTLFHRGTAWNNVLESKALAYLASISYALYVWHPLATHGWFEAGTKAMKYAKRPLGIALSFGLAHVSTFYFESFWIDLGKRLTQNPRKPVQLPKDALSTA